MSSKAIVLEKIKLFLNGEHDGYYFTKEELRIIVDALEQKPRITGKFDAEHADEMDNRDAEPIDITDDNARCHLGFDGEELCHCPHCGCTIPLFNVMSNHYCYVCGGKFGKRILSWDNSADDDDEE